MYRRVKIEKRLREEIITTYLYDGYKRSTAERLADDFIVLEIAQQHLDSGFALLVSETVDSGRVVFSNGIQTSRKS